MKLSTNISYLDKRRGTSEERDILESARLLRDAGYKFLDFFVYDHYVDDESYISSAEKLRSDFEGLGLKVDQTHAPYVFEKVEPELYKQRMQRAFEMSHLLGAEHIVIHADNYIPDEKGYDFNKALETVYDFYAPYVEYAKSVGLGVAIENLFETNRARRTRFTSYVEEQIAIIDKFNDPGVTACWDFGHGKVSYGAKHLEAMKQVGSRITCTHVHDNAFGMDLHQNLFFGDCDWEQAIADLKSFGYSGKFTFEMVYGCLPDALLPRYMKLFYDTGDYLVNGTEK